MKERYIRLIRNIVESLKLKSKLKSKLQQCMKEVRENITVAEWSDYSFNNKEIEKALDFLGKELVFDFFKDYVGLQTMSYANREEYAANVLKKLLKEFNKEVAEVLND